MAVLKSLFSILFLKMGLRKKGDELMKKTTLLSITGALLFIYGQCLAGKGMFIHITNNSGETINTSASDVNCMYHTSDLTTTINNGSSSPSIYVEQKESGGCDSSAFNLNISGASSGQSAVVFYDGATGGCGVSPRGNQSSCQQSGIPYQGCGFNEYCFSWDATSVSANNQGGTQLHVYITVTPFATPKK